MTNGKSLQNNEKRGKKAEKKELGPPRKTMSTFDQWKFVFIVPHLCSLRKFSF